MRGLPSHAYPLLIGAWLGLASAGMSTAAQPAGSGFGEIAIPDPPKPARAESCVEPVEIMRRQHMNFLDQQRDRTVIDGERNARYSLVGCMDCHNPVNASGEAPRYENPEHFCAACHAYASVDIDCFECHADRGYGDLQQGLNGLPDMTAGNGELTAATLQRRLDTAHGD